MSRDRFYNIYTNKENLTSEELENFKNWLPNKENDDVFIILNQETQTDSTITGVIVEISK